MTPQVATDTFINLLFADDIVILATSYEQASRMLNQVVDTLAAIGLTLSLEKKQIHSLS